MRVSRVRSDRKSEQCGDPGLKLDDALVLRLVQLYQFAKLGRLGLHIAMMNEVIALLPEFVASDREIIRRVPVCDAVSARDPSEKRR